MGRRPGSWLWKGTLIVFLLVAGLVGAFVALASREYTDCFADIRKRDAAGVLDRADALGLDDADVIEHRHSASIRISSGETGDDAAEFRRAVRRLTGGGGMHCNERPYFN